MLALTFSRPEYLALLALLPVLWFWPRRLRDRWHGVLRTLAVACIVFALAAPLVVVADSDRHQVVIIDRSASVVAADRQSASRLAARLASRSSDDTVWHLVEIGAQGPSPLGDALGRAGLRIPDGSRGAVTLMTDGRATDRLWSVATEQLTARGIPVHTIVLRGNDDVRPVGLTAPGGLRVGQTGRVEVDVVGRADAVRVTLEGPSGVLARSAPAAVGGRRRFVLEFEPKAPGFFEFRARVEAGADALPADNVIRRSLAVQDPLRVLYLGGRVAAGAAKLAGLLGPGFTVEDGKPAELASYDLVVADDRPARDLPERLQRDIAEAVVDRGTGFVMSGGQAAFGPGGYHRSTLEEILPVEFVQKEEKKDPSTALAIIIDTSGSMTGSRIDIAKEVTRLAIRRLLPHDKVGIVEFFGNKRWAAPLQSAANAIDIQRALNRLDAGGGTVLYPAIEEAYYGLRNVQTRYKHVLLLTDAGVETGPYEKLLRRMAREGMCVSTVLVGAGRHSEFLVELASWGNGRFYNASNRYNLPEILLKQPSSARLPAYRPGRHEVEAHGGPRWWGEGGVQAVPALDGYVETRRRPGAEVVLATRREKHPILASWAYGLGRVTALTTEPTGPGTRSWRDWSDYGAFLARVFARTAAAGRLPFAFELERRGGELTLRAERRERSARRPEAVVLGKPGAAQRIEFRERAPGVFTAQFERSRFATVRIVAGTDDPALGRERLVGSRARDAADELQVDPHRGLDLAALARATGGQTLPVDAASDFRPTAGGGARPIGVRELWPLCLLLALIAFLADVVWRRTPR